MNGAALFAVLKEMGERAQVAQDVDAAREGIASQAADDAAAHRAEQEKAAGHAMAARVMSSTPDINMAAIAARISRPPARLAIPDGPPTVNIKRIAARLAQGEPS